MLNANFAFKFAYTIYTIIITKSHANVWILRTDDVYLKYKTGIEVFIMMKYYLVKRNEKTEGETNLKLQM